jgi:hypothetical protein
MTVQELIASAAEEELALGGDPKSVASAVVSALAEDGWAVVDRATLEQLRECYGDEFTDALAAS